MTRPFNFRVGDVVRLRCGGTATLTKINPDFVHSGEDGWQAVTGSFYPDGVPSLFDIVEIVERGPRRRKTKEAAES